MLKTICIKDVASYNDAGTSFTNLKRVNFIYGNNGTGKSTFSKYFNYPKEGEYINCDHEGNLESIRFIYNKKFIEDNFKSDFPGIFTLGKDHIDSEEEVERLYDEIDKRKIKYDAAQENLIKTTEEFDDIRNSFKELIWNKKIVEDTIINKIYSQAFKGLHGSKERFLETYIQNVSDYEQGIDEMEVLYSKYDVLFDENKTEIPLISQIVTIEDINSEIFEKPIIGGKELELEELTRKLDIHKWLHDGSRIIDQNNLEGLGHN